MLKIVKVLGTVGSGKSLKLAEIAALHSLERVVICSPEIAKNALKLKSKKFNKENIHPMDSIYEMILYAEKKRNSILILDTAQSKNIGAIIGKLN